MQPTHKRDDNWTRLLTRVGKQRDPAAFKALYYHFAPLIKGFCLSNSRLALSPQASEELVEEVMLSIWQKAPHFEAHKSSASTWVFTVMRNCRMEMVRRKARRPEVPVDAEAEVSVDDIWDDTTENQPFFFLQQPRHESALSRSLQNLPPEQLHVLKKIYMEGKSHSDITAELGLPLGTVKSRVRLALRKLQSNAGK